MIPRFSTEVSTHDSERQFFEQNNAAWHKSSEAERDVVIFRYNDGYKERYTMLRIDDIPQHVADDIHAFGEIGTRDCGKLLNYLEKYGIIHLKR
jgi:phosphoribosylaminoimidazole-succinocarboxamide synthase